MEAAKEESMTWHDWSIDRLLWSTAEWGKRLHDSHPKLWRWLVGLTWLGVYLPFHWLSYSYVRRPGKNEGRYWNAVVWTPVVTVSLNWAAPIQDRHAVFTGVRLHIPGYHGKKLELGVTSQLPERHSDAIEAAMTAYETGHYLTGLRFFS
jgi:hypothetical protein